MFKLLKNLCIFVLVLSLALLSINFYVVYVGNKEIKESVKDVSKADCVLVLGASVKPNGEPSLMLKERLDKGIDLYFAKKADKILLSGDNGQVNYNEVKVMYKYVKKAGIPSKNVFLDHAGFSTYDSIYRAKEVFNVKSAIIVTQKYHLYRSTYIGKTLGMEVSGVKADKKRYIGQTARDFREILARIKDFGKCIHKPEPKYLGEIIDINGEGNGIH